MVVEWEDPRSVDLDNSLEAAAEECMNRERASTNIFSFHCISLHLAEVPLDGLRYRFVMGGCLRGRAGRCEVFR